PLTLPDAPRILSATGTFATIILERLLDVVTVLALLASFVFIFGREMANTNPTVFAGLKWAGAHGRVGVRHLAAEYEDEGRQQRENGHHVKKAFENDRGERSGRAQDPRSVG